MNAEDFYRNTGYPEQIDKHQMRIPDFDYHDMISFAENYADSKVKKKPSLLIIGHGRHGKDTVAELISEFNDLSFRSSSLMAAEVFIYDILKDKYNYGSPAECYADRHNRRAEWYGLIRAYNFNEPSRLAQDILERADGYVGMRDRKEIERCKELGLFDLIIWVDASKRLPDESSDSFNISIDQADIVIDNNGTEQELRDKVLRLCKTIAT